MACSSSGVKSCAWAGRGAAGAGAGEKRAFPAKGGAARTATHVLDVERLPDLLGRLALDEAGHLCAREVQEGLDVHVVCGEDELKEHLLR